MEKKKFFFILVATCLVVFLMVVFALPKQAAIAFVGVPKTTDSKSIQETIIKSYKIMDKAAVTFDNIPDFDSVFVNDARGGKLSPSQLKLMQDITQEPSKTYFGYLDFMVAYFTSWGKGAAAVDGLDAKLKKEKRNATKEEMQSLVDSAGKPASPRSSGEEEPTKIEFISIAVDGDQAIATFDDGPRTNEMTLVKIDGKWLIAGNKILSIHP
jgi:hypothetical protein